ncbi:hypothetical protein TNCV_1108571 [Trichonephila clavipes]|nr:hypothetical protein TNCV_1108571 [Trichonephila clavipes]
MTACMGVDTPARAQTINNGPMATCKGHLTTGEAIKFSENRWIVRVHYFVRGGFAGIRSCKFQSISPHLPVELDSSGGQKGLSCTCKLHVWASCLQRNRPDVDVFEK